jgi:hypothetical protein
MTPNVAKGGRRYFPLPRRAIACPSFPPRPVLRERVGVRVDIRSGQEIAKVGWVYSPTITDCGIRHYQCSLTRCEVRGE